MRRFLVWCGQHIYVHPLAPIVSVTVLVIALTTDPSKPVLLVLFIIVALVAVGGIRYQRSPRHPERKS